MRVRLPKIGTLVTVTWLDAAGYIGIPMGEAAPAICNTVGWLAAINKDHVVLATSKYKDDVGDWTVLPLGVIEKCEAHK